MSKAFVKRLASVKPLKALVAGTFVVDSAGLFAYFVEKVRGKKAYGRAVLSPAMKLAKDELIELPVTYGGWLNSPIVYKPLTKELLKTVSSEKEKPKNVKAKPKAAAKANAKRKSNR